MEASESSANSATSCHHVEAEWLNTEDADTLSRVSEQEMMSPEKEFRDTVLHCMGPDHSQLGITSPRPVETLGASSGFDEPTWPGSATRGLKFEDQLVIHAARLNLAYTRFVRKPTFAAVSLGAKWPCACISIQTVVLVIIIVFGMAAHPINVDMDFDSFLKTDVKSSILFEAFWAAERGKPKYPLRRRLQAVNETVNGTVFPAAKVVYAPAKDLYILYELKDVNDDGAANSISSLLRERALHWIADFERSLRSEAIWTQLCGRVGEEHGHFCNPGITLPGYTLPTMTLDSKGVTPEKLIFDGSGWDSLPLSTSLGLLEHHEFGSLLLPTDFIKGGSQGDLRYLRSAFRFRIPAGTEEDTPAQRSAAFAQASDDWDKFAGELIPLLADAVPNEFIKLYFDGTGFKDLEISEALNGDLTMATGSIVTVFFYVLFHTRSMLLTIAGIIICLASVPLAYVATAVITGSTTINFTAFLAIFLAVGFGCDVIFVYSDFWIESSKKFDDKASRLAWTYTHAGRASFVTTATSALSFFANLASVIRALRQFGFFMGLCVMLAWLLVTMIYAPLCIFDERIKCCRLHGGEKKKLGAHRIVMLNAWCTTIHKYRRTFVILPALFLIGGLALSVVMVKPATDIPKLFPSEHNRVAGETVRDLFEAADKTAFSKNSVSAPASVNVCSLDPTVSPAECALYWCEDQTGIDQSPTAAPAKADYAFLFDGHCAAGWITGSSTQKDTMAMCATSCRNNTGCAYFAYNSKTPETVNCALYDAVGGCPNDGFPTNYSVYTMTDEATSCSCSRKYNASSCPGATTAAVVIRIISNTTLATRLRALNAHDTASVLSYLMKAPDVGTGYAHKTGYTAAASPDLVQHEWETGEVRQQSVTSITLAMDRTPESWDTCGWTEICHCGSVKPCTLDSSWASASSIDFLGESLGVMPTGVERRLQGEETSVTPFRSSSLLQPFSFGRSLQAIVNPPFTAKVASSKRLKVRVAFGLNINSDVQMLGERAEGDMWAYSKTFEAKYPWTQRHLWKFCTDLETSAALRVTSNWCWISSFRTWLVKEQGERFPLQPYRFEELSLKYLSTGTGSMAGDRYVWVVDNVMKAFYASFSVDFNIYSDADAVIAEMNKWTDYVDTWNEASVAQAKGAFHVSDTWVEAEANQQLISSAVETLVILLLLAFVFMVLFTWSLAMSLFVVMSTIAAILGLTFFIVVVMRWTVGLIEVIAIVYFIGYAVTYSLHIAHKYACEEKEEPTHPVADEHAGPMGSPGAGVGPLTPGGQRITAEEAVEIRHRRARYALTSMGAATLGSAATTAGASLFLTMATLTIFQRLGTMCLTVTLVSIVVALGPLPAALMIAGPLRPGKGFARCLQRCSPCLPKRLIDFAGIGGTSASSSPTSATPDPHGVGKDLSHHPGVSETSQERRVSETSQADVGFTLTNASTIRRE